MLTVALLFKPLIIGYSSVKDISALHKTGNSRACIACRTNAARIEGRWFASGIAADSSSGWCRQPLPLRLTELVGRVMIDYHLR